MRNKIDYFIITFRLVFLFLLVLGIIFDIFFLRTNSDFLIIGVVILWLTVNLKFNFDGSFSILIALLLLGLNLVISLFEKMPVIYGSKLEKASIWIYIFLTIGIIKKILEMKKQSTSLLKLSEMIISIRQRTAKENIRVLRLFLNLEIKKIVIFYFKYMWFIPYVFKKIREIRILDLLSKLSEIKFPEVKIPVINIPILKIPTVKIPILKMPTVKFEGINNRFNKIKQSNTLIFIIKVPLVHLVLSLLIIKKIVKEILFYREFFGNNFLFQINNRISPKIVILWSSIGIFVLLFLLLKQVIYNKIIFLHKRKKTFEWFVIVALMMVTLMGNKKIFLLERDKFEFRPYIQRLSVDISSRYSEVMIYGRNFREMPFEGRVYINDKPQRINSWDDREINIEIDPIQSETGELRIVNDYGFGSGIESNKAAFTYFDSRKSSKTDEDRFWKSLKDLVIERIISLFGRPKKILNNTR